MEEQDLTFEQLDFLVEHEKWHEIFKKRNEMKTERERIAFNVATDMAINEALFPDQEKPKFLSFAEATAWAMEKIENEKDEISPLEEEDNEREQENRNIFEIKNILSILKAQKNRIADLFAETDKDKLGYIQLNEAINHLLSAEFFLNLITKEEFKNEIR